MGAQRVATQQEIAELLLLHGADCNACDAHGTTPLHAAVYYGRLGLVRLLIAHGAEPNAVADAASLEWKSREYSSSATHRRHHHHHLSRETDERDRGSVERCAEHRRRRTTSRRPALTTARRRALTGV